MKQFKFLATASILLISSLVQGQNNAGGMSKNNNSLLWEISGNGLAKSSYLFGTYHMICKDQFAIKSKVATALQKSDGIVTEVNFLDSAEISAMQGMLMTKNKWSETLGEAKQQQLGNALQPMGLNLKQVDNFSLTLLYSLAAFKAKSCASADIKTIDVELMKLAKDSGKSLGALETFASQHSIIEKAYSIDDVIKQMDNATENKKLYARLADAYMSEDLVLLDTLLRNPAIMNEEQEKYMLTQRNNNWVTKMPDLMKNKSLFFAVGAGHLWGNEGILNLLIQKGYTVKPIFQ